MKNLSKIFFVFALILYGTNTVIAQESINDDKAIKTDEVKNLLYSGRYTFEATKLISKQTGTSPIKPKYDLDISKDTVIAYLPRSANEQIMPDSLSKNAGIEFTCTNFDYTIQPAANGGWHVSIKPKAKPLDNTKNIRLIDLEISSRGYTTLTITQTNNNHFSYYGYIRPHSAVFPKVRMQDQNNSM